MRVYHLLPDASSTTPQISFVQPDLLFCRGCCDLFFSFIAIRVRLLCLNWLSRRQPPLNYYLYDRHCFYRIRITFWQRYALVNGVPDLPIVVDTYIGIRPLYVNLIGWLPPSLPIPPCQKSDRDMQAFFGKAGAWQVRRITGVMNRIKNQDVWRLPALVGHIYFQRYACLLYFYDYLLLDRNVDYSSCAFVAIWKQLCWTVSSIWAPCI